MERIFLVEDDPKLEDIVKQHLEKYNYSVDTVTDFSDVVHEFEQCKPDLVLLDINLPYFDGFYLCRLLRKKSHVPIIIISARSSDTEQIMGMEFGADDYLVKPFNLEILTAKVKANLRRTSKYKTDYTLEVKGLSIDENTFKMTYKHKEVELTKNEIKLMKCLLENKENYVKREILLEVLWDDKTFVDENTLTVNVTRVKQKLKELGLENVIKTKRAVGYKLELGQSYA